MAVVVENVRQPNQDGRASRITGAHRVGVGGQVCDQFLQESRRATHVDRDRHVERTAGLVRVQRGYCSEKMGDCGVHRGVHPRCLAGKPGRG